MPHSARGQLASLSSELRAALISNRQSQTYSANQRLAKEERNVQRGQSGVGWPDGFKPSGVKPPDPHPITKLSRTTRPQRTSRAIPDTPMSEWICGILGLIVAPPIDILQMSIGSAHQALKCLGRHLTNLDRGIENPSPAQGADSVFGSVLANAWPYDMC